MAHIRPMFKFPSVSRLVVAPGDKYTWEVAEHAYHRASTQHIAPANHIPWASLPPTSQDTWYWMAKAVMQALADLE